MNTFRMPRVPERADAGCARAPPATVLHAFSERLAAWDPGDRGLRSAASDWRACLPPVLTLVNEMLGEGEVSIRVDGVRPYRIQESVFTGFWRVCGLDGEGHAGRGLAGSRRAAPRRDRGRPRRGGRCAAARQRARRRHELAGAARRDRQPDGGARRRRSGARDQPHAVPDDAGRPRGAGAGAAGRSRRDDLARLRQLPHHLDGRCATSGACSISTA